MEEKEELSERFDKAKCKSCGHVLNEHYQLKSTGYSCVGESGKCTCISFSV